PAPARAPRPAAGAAPVAPPAGNGPQAQIAAIWGRILGLDPAGIGAGDNFFALGGHSLLAVQAHREIRSTLGRPDLSITDIFRFPTLGGLAGHLDAGGTEPEPPVVPDQDRSETISKRRAMRDRRRMRAG
ncbi:acyl carrier protein, partial [Antarcticimicrobium luteum]